MTQQEFDSRHPGGWPRKHSRLREAWWVLTGQHSLHMAWQAGLHEGSRSEYQRVVVNGGDLMPVMNATICATVAEIMDGQEPQGDTMDAIRRKAWQRYESERRILSRLGLATVRSNGGGAT